MGDHLFAEGGYYSARGLRTRIGLENTLYFKNIINTNKLIRVKINVGRKNIS